MPDESKHGEPTTAALREANAALQRALAEQELRLRALHHRIKNNLAVISSLVHLHARRLDSKRDAATLRALHQRIAAMSLVHEQLYQTPEVERLELCEYLRRLVEALRRSSLAPPPSIAVEFGPEPLSLPVELALPAGQLVSELLANAIDHGARERPDARVRIALERAPASFTISVADDGPGLPPGFDPATDGAFGWLLIRTLATQLDAALELRPGPGAEVRVTIPLPQ